MLADGTSISPHSYECPRGVPAGERWLQDACAGQMSRLPLSDHVKMLERRARQQAGLQEPQGPAGQKLLRDGLTTRTTLPVLHALGRWVAAESWTVDSSVI